MFAIDQPYTFLLIASVIISITMAVAVLMHKRTLGVHAFAALQGSIGMWALTSLFEVCSTDMPTKIFSYSFKYFFIVMVPLSWFIFGLYYSNRLRRLRISHVGLLGIIPALTLIMVATNRYHGWMFTSLDSIKVGEVTFIVREFGFWFWIHATYSYILLFLGFFFMAKQLIDSPSPYRRQVVTLLIGGMVPWLANMAFIYHLTPCPYLDLTPFAFTVSGIAFMLGVLRFQLLDVTPMAHEVVIQNLADAVLVVDSAQRILNLNRAARNLADLDASQPIGMRAGRVFSWWTDLQDDGAEEPRAGSSVLDLSMGERRRLLRLKKAPLACDQRAMGLLITLTDVTDALLAKEALLNSERRFRSFCENAPVIIFTLDTQGVVTYLSPAWDKILGQDRAELIGRRFVDLIADTGTQGCENTFEELIRGQKSVAELNLTLLHKSGSRRLFNTSLAANSDTEDRITGIIGLAKDITEERKLQYQLFQSQKMEAIGTLAGGVAHDFNNLLMGMQANLSLLRLDQGPGGPGEEKIQRIENQIQSGAALTRQLLGYARKGQYVVTAVDMHLLIEEALDVVQRTNKKITSQSLFSDMPAFIMADRGQMEMVLLNLFLNAADAMPDGGRLTVCCRPVAGGQSHSPQLGEGRNTGVVEIIVADTGIGMDQATQDRIFEPFFTTKEVGRGSGLGLASVYGVVQNHGGQIQVESAPGQGTTFTLIFPAADAPPEAPKSAVAKKRAPLGGGTVLLVEDEPLILKYCREMIQGLAFEVLTAAGGPAAIEIYKQQREKIDLVILDMIMPGMDGFGVFQILKKINPNIKVIITSGYTVDRRMNQILASGPHGYLKKPYTLDELSEEIARTITRKTPKKEFLALEAARN
jgi:two-component system, cell cycle sensor histidine kinase and response regulator CckA